jgi:hypothetical protein
MLAFACWGQFDFNWGGMICLVFERLRFQDRRRPCMRVVVRFVEQMAETLHFNIRVSIC